MIRQTIAFFYNCESWQWNFFQINVNGPSAHPLYKYLKRKTGSLEIRWNFNKILVVDGIPVKRYPADVDPNDMVPDLMKYLDVAEDAAHELWAFII